ncbi:LOW QUALITY PROTEIN: uncharacterized protein LOC133519480 [Cydia pomonella]|uniref:LOW QUALITY PROTEIN: uncharacterized protein LOC133519480 n=1 Tax=Cydia pomonella TaxID=82600 RepID=UPI002ADDED3A|nr:LOW QUALITY PROTEIN: uncharacterized protein LOC133519480 [Cydia pomonella]
MATSENWFNRRKGKTTSDVFKLDIKNKTPKENVISIIEGLYLMKPFHHEVSPTNKTVPKITVFRGAQRSSSDTRKLSYLNALVTLLGKEDISNLGFTSDELMTCIRISLVDESMVLRAAALRVLRYLIRTESDVATFNNLRLPYLVTRSMDLMLRNEEERAQALRVVRRVVAIVGCVGPRRLRAARVDEGLLRCLAAVARAGAGDGSPDRLARPAIATLAEICVLNPDLFIACGGVTAVSRQLAECATPHMAEALCGVLLHTLNEPASRNAARIDLTCLSFPYCDFHNRPQGDANKDEREMRFTCSRLALLCVLRSWPGLLHFCHPRNSGGLRAMVSALYLPRLEVRKAILDLLYELVGLPQPEWTDEISVALAAVDPSDFQDSWRLNEGFVAAEGTAILPHLSATGSDITEIHLALLLQCFLEAGLLDGLTEVIVTSDTFISVRATVLLGQLLHLIHLLLPPQVCSITPALPLLMSQAASGRPQALAAVAALRRLHAIHEARPASHSLFLDHIIQYCSGAYRHKPEDTSKSRKEIDNANMAKPKNFMYKDNSIEFLNESDNEEPKQRHSVGSRADVANRNYGVLVKSKSVSSRTGAAVSKVTKSAKFFNLFDRDSDNLIRCTLVMQNKDGNTWNWEFIRAILKENDTAPLLNLCDSGHKAWVARIINYLKPSSNKYSHTDVSTTSNGHATTRAGCQLIRHLLRHNDADSQRLLEELFWDVSRQVEAIETGRRAHECLFSPQHMSNTMCQMYFLFIGQLCHSHTGLDLLKQTNLYDNLLELSTKTHHSCYVKLVISSLDYTLDSYPRDILAKTLTCSIQASRLYATQFLTVLLRASQKSKELVRRRSKLKKNLVQEHLKSSQREEETSGVDMDTWLLQMLIAQLKDESKSVVKCAVMALEEAYSVPALLEKLVLQKNVLGHNCGFDKSTEPAALDMSVAGDRGYLVWLGLEIAAAAGAQQDHKAKAFIKKHVDYWVKNYNYRYVRLVEAAIHDALALCSGGGGARARARRTARPPPHALHALARASHLARAMLPQALQPALTVRNTQIRAPSGGGDPRRARAVLGRRRRACSCAAHGAAAAARAARARPRVTPRARHAAAGAAACSNVEAAIHDALALCSGGGGARARARRTARPPPHALHALARASHLARAMLPQALQPALTAAIHDALALCSGGGGARARARRTARPPPHALHALARASHLARAMLPQALQPALTAAIHDALALCSGGGGARARARRTARPPPHALHALARASHLARAMLPQALQPALTAAIHDALALCSGGGGARARARRTARPPPHALHALARASHLARAMLPYVRLVEAAIHDALALCSGGGGARARARRTARPPPHALHALARASHLARAMLPQALQPALTVLQRKTCVTEQEIMDVKASLWAVGNAALHPLGLQQLLSLTNPSEESIPVRVVGLAKHCPVYSVRATAFYVLGLIGSTYEGANLLSDLGWLCVRHTRQDQFPIIQDEFYAIHNPTLNFIASPERRFQVFDAEASEHSDHTDLSESLHSEITKPSKINELSQDMVDSKLNIKEPDKRKSHTLPSQGASISRTLMTESRTVDILRDFDRPHRNPAERLISRMNSLEHAHEGRVRNTSESSTSGVSSCDSVLGKYTIPDRVLTLSPIPSSSSLYGMKGSSGSHRPRLSETQRRTSSSSFTAPDVSSSPPSQLDMSGYATLISLNKHRRPHLSESAASGSSDMDDLSWLLSDTHRRSKPFSSLRDRAKSTRERMAKLSLLDYDWKPLCVAESGSGEARAPRSAAAQAAPAPAAAAGPPPHYIGICLPRDLQALFPRPRPRPPPPPARRRTTSASVCRATCRRCSRGESRVSTVLHHSRPGRARARRRRRPAAALHRHLSAARPAGAVPEVSRVCPLCCTTPAQAAPAPAAAAGPPPHYIGICLPRDLQALFPRPRPRPPPPPARRRTTSASVCRATCRRCSRGESRVSTVLHHSRPGRARARRRRRPAAALHRHLSAARPAGAVPEVSRVCPLCCTSPAQAAPAPAAAAGPPPHYIGICLPRDLQALFPRPRPRPPPPPARRRTTSASVCRATCRRCSRGESRVSTVLHHSRPGRARARRRRRPAAALHRHLSAARPAGAVPEVSRVCPLCCTTPAQAAPAPAAAAGPPPHYIGICLPRDLQALFPRVACVHCAAPLPPRPRPRPPPPPARRRTTSASVCRATCRRCSRGESRVSTVLHHSRPGRARARRRRRPAAALHRHLSAARPAGAVPEVSRVCPLCCTTPAQAAPAPAAAAGPPPHYIGICLPRDLQALFPSELHDIDVEEKDPLKVNKSSTLLNDTSIASTEKPRLSKCLEVDVSSSTDVSSRISSATVTSRTLTDRNKEANPKENEKAIERQSSVERSFNDSSSNIDKEAKLESTNDGKWRHAANECLACVRTRPPSSHELREAFFFGLEGGSGDSGRAASAPQAELLHHVRCMSNPIYLRQTRSAVLSLKQKHPDVFRSACVYSDVCGQLARATYLMCARRFLHELFLDASFECFAAEPRALLARHAAAPPSPPTRGARSSTGAPRNDGERDNVLLNAAST